MMAARSPARFLAPIALVAVAFALYTIVQDARDKGAGGASSSGAPAQTTPSKSAKKTSKAAKRKAAARRRHKTYVVKSGDTPTGIAAKFGLSLQALEKLNPDLDPQALTVGQRLKLRK